MTISSVQLPTGKHVDRSSGAEPIRPGGNRGSVNILFDRKTGARYEVEANPGWTMGKHSPPSCTITCGRSRGPAREYRVLGCTSRMDRAHTHHTVPIPALCACCCRGQRRALTASGLVRGHAGDRAKTQAIILGRADMSAHSPRHERTSERAQLRTSEETAPRTRPSLMCRQSVHHRTIYPHGSSTFELMSYRAVDPARSNHRTRPRAFITQTGSPARSVTGRV